VLLWAGPCALARGCGRSPRAPAHRFIEATTYYWAVEYEHVAGVLARLLWGTDTSAFYRDIAPLGELPSGTGVLDLPCSGGVAFRRLRAEQELDYVAADARISRVPPR
jgi:hypothetical protein